MLIEATNLKNHFEMKRRQAVITGAGVSSEQTRRETALAELIYGEVVDYICRAEERFKEQQTNQKKLKF